jgi:hypothetical protein
MKKMALIIERMNSTVRRNNMWNLRERVSLRMKKKTRRRITLEVVVVVQETTEVLLQLRQLLSATEEVMVVVDLKMRNRIFAIKMASNNNVLLVSSSKMNRWAYRLPESITRSKKKLGRVAIQSTAIPQTIVQTDSEAVEDAEVAEVVTLPPLVLVTDASVANRTIMIITKIWSLPVLEPHLTLRQQRNLLLSSKTRITIESLLLKTGHSNLIKKMAPSALESHVVKGGMNPKTSETVEIIVIVENGIETIVSEAIESNNGIVMTDL